MPWTVRLEDERGQPVNKEYAFIDFVGSQNVRPDGLLRYLDPYGDTIFNQPQIGDFITEWRAIKPTEPTQTKEWQKVLDSALRCEAEVHLYLRFMGD